VDAGAIAVIDGGDGMRQALTSHTVEEAIHRSRAHGIGAVGLRNSNHFSMAM
jgi:LDH2 family malate/lactate/ureidoglycolate dehydrogenase